jgi:protoporphyrinogen oxidase
MENRRRLHAGMTNPIRIAVIGGGWAGLAAAARLVEQSLRSNENPCIVVTVFEASPQFGGRARGLTWTLDNGKTLAIDNGQHLAIGAYTHTMALLKKVNAPAWQQEPLVWTGVGCQRIDQQWPVPSVAWPWRLLPGLLPGRGPKGWPLAWKSAMPRLLWALTRSDAHETTMRAAEWLTDRGAPKEFIAHFWRPLVEGALNTALEEASAAVMVQVLRDSLLGRRSSTDVLTPPNDLSSDGVIPIANWLQRNGVELRLNHRVRHISPLEAAPTRQQTLAEQRWSVTTERQSAQQAREFDRVVIALPAPATLALWDQSRLPETSSIERLKTLQHRAITTIWIALRERGEAILERFPSWFIFHPIQGVPHVAQVGVKRPGVLALVISAQNLEQPDSHARRETHASRLQSQLKIQLGLDIEGLPQKWITEKSATWACTADLHPLEQNASLGHIGLPGLFRAADDLEPGYPATIESAVRSGERTADTVITTLNN